MNFFEKTRKFENNIFELQNSLTTPSLKDAIEDFSEGARMIPNHKCPNCDNKPVFVTKKKYGMEYFSNADKILSLFDTDGNRY